MQTKIYKNTFKGCSNLKHIKLPNNISAIDDCAFQDCSSLNNINIGVNVKNIGVSAFQNNISLTSVDRFFDSDPSHTFDTVGDYAFENTGLYNINLALRSSSIYTFWGDGVFQNCKSLSSVNILSANYLSKDMFKGCTNLQNVTFNQNFMAYTYPYVFDGCTSLREITLPSQLLYLSEGMFQNCTNLQHVKFNTYDEDKSGIYLIQQNAFYNTPNMKSISLPASINSIEQIDQRALSGCGSQYHTTIISGLTEIRDAINFSKTPTLSLDLFGINKRDIYNENMAPYIKYGEDYTITSVEEAERFQLYIADKNKYNLDHRDRDVYMFITEFVGHTNDDFYIYSTDNNILSNHFYNIKGSNLQLSIQSLYGDNYYSSRYPSFSNHSYQLTSSNQTYNLSNSNVITIRFLIDIGVIDNDKTFRQTLSEYVKDTNNNDKNEKYNLLSYIYKNKYGIYDYNNCVVIRYSQQYETDNQTIGYRNKTAEFSMKYTQNQKAKLLANIYKDIIENNNLDKRFKDTHYNMSLPVDIMNVNMALVDNFVFGLGNRKCINIKCKDNQYNNIMQTIPIYDKRLYISNILPYKKRINTSFYDKNPQFKDIPHYTSDTECTSNFERGKWYYNAKQIYQYAKQHKIPCLFIYSLLGCGPCQVYQTKLWNTPEFQEWFAKQNFLLCGLEVTKQPLYDEQLAYCVDVISPSAKNFIRKDLGETEQSSGKTVNALRQTFNRTISSNGQYSSNLMTPVLIFMDKNGDCWDYTYHSIATQIKSFGADGMLQQLKSLCLYYFDNNDLNNTQYVVEANKAFNYDDWQIRPDNPYLISNNVINLGYININTVDEAIRNIQQQLHASSYDYGLYIGGCMWSSIDYINLTYMEFIFNLEDGTADEQNDILSQYKFKIGSKYYNLTLDKTDSMEAILCGALYTIHKMSFIECS